MSLLINTTTASGMPVVLRQADTASKIDSKPVIPFSLIAESASASISSPSSSMGKVEVMEEPPQSWTKTAEDMIKAAQIGCSPKQVFTFDQLIKAHREALNENEGWQETTTFHQLAKYGAPLQFVDVLFRNGADNNVQDGYGDTPLMWAVANAENGMAREILRKLPSSQVNSLNKQCIDVHNTALHILIAKGYTHISFHGEALACSNFELLQLAVSLGANINLADIHGNTPLHLAYARRDAQVVDFLLKQGADRSAVNKAGQKPVDLIQIGSDEATSYAKAKELMTTSVDFLFILNERNYNNAENLKKLIKL